MTSLADRLNHIIEEQNISKADFAKRIGVTRNYISILTGSNPRKTAISPSLAKLIAVEFGYNEKWLQTGEGEARQL